MYSNYNKKNKYMGEVFYVRRMVNLMKTAKVSKCIHHVYIRKD